MTGQTIVSTRPLRTEPELRELCTDPDPRVRSDAIRELERMCALNGGVLSMDSYTIVRELCSNSATNVRLSALRILGKFACKYGELTIRNQRGYELRLHDDAFTIMCHGINDSETKVRTEATEMLSQFVNVSDAFLHQTLDKKIMNAMKISATGGPRRVGMSGGWSTGRKLAEAPSDLPADDEEEEKSIIPSGTCGAFVTALEDEFMSVRLAAVFSLGILAAGRPDFARAAIDHLADMFNDEMQEVRFASIKALTPMITHGKLDRDQLYAVLNVLSDATADNRLALHELLSLSHLNDTGCVQQVLKALLESLHRFPRDRDSIYRCLSSIGRNHAFFVHPLVPELFNLHPVFESQEQNVNDDYYLGRLILALNAAAVHPPIRSLLPTYIARHYRFVRCATPALIPEIVEYERARNARRVPIQPMKSEIEMEVDESKPELKPVNVRPRPADYRENYLDVIYARILDSFAHPRPDERAALLELILKDLNISENVEEHIAVPIRLLKTFCQLLHHYDAALRFRYDEIATLGLIEECLTLIAQIRHLFNGVQPKLLIFVAECSFQLNIQYLLIRLRLDPRVEKSVIRRIRDEITQLQNQCLALSTSCSSVALDCVAWLLEFLNSHPATSQSASSGEKSAAKKLAALPLTTNDVNVALVRLAELRLPPPAKIPHLRKCTLRTVLVTDVNDGQGQQLGRQECVHRFVAGVPTGIQLHAHLFNLTPADEREFRVEVTYPDEWHDYQRPKTFELERISGRLCRLRMTLLLNADQWAEASDIRIRCGLITSVRVDEEDDCAPLTFSAAAALSTLSATRSTSALSTARRSPAPSFVPLNDANRPSHPNLVSVRIFPMSRC